MMNFKRRRQFYTYTENVVLYVPAAVAPQKLSTGFSPVIGCHKFIFILGLFDSLGHCVEECEQGGSLIRYPHI